MNYTILDLPKEDRPRERLASQGAEALSNTELIAIILGSGMRGRSVLQLAQELLSHFGGLQQLALASIHELCEVAGMGPAKAIQLKAALALGLRTTMLQQPIRPRIQTPAHAFEIVKELFFNETRERFVALMLDSKSGLISQETISIGTLNESLVHPRELFFPAIKQKASSLIVVHNHPSGDLTPSKEDIDLTRQLVEIGNLLGIPLQDHLIVHKSSFRSLRQTGVAF
jgi:DNA repair protein RadC